MKISGQVLFSKEVITTKPEEGMELDFRIGFLAFWLLFLVMTAVGFYGLSPDFEVEPEYMSGMLTASSIIFGFWVILVQTKPKERIRKWLYEQSLSVLFFVSFGLLILSVLLIYFAALNRFPSVMALYFCMISFLLNAVNLMLALYYYKFKESGV